MGSDPDFAGSSYSIDDGLTWTNIDAIQHVDVAFFSDTTGYSGGFTVSSNTGGVFVYSSNVLSSDNFAFAKAISVYPNPTNDLINITGTDSILKVELINLSRQSIRNLQPSNSVSLEGIANGMYFIKITTDKGMETLPIIKE